IRALRHPPRRRVPAEGRRAPPLAASSQSRPPARLPRPATRSRTPVASTLRGCGRASPIPPSPPWPPPRVQRTPFRPPIPHRLPPPPPHSPALHHACPPHP